MTRSRVAAHFCQDGLDVIAKTPNRGSREILNLEGNTRASALYRGRDGCLAVPFRYSKIVVDARHFGARRCESCLAGQVFLVAVRERALHNQALIVMRTGNGDCRRENFDFSERNLRIGVVISDRRYLSFVCGCRFRFVFTAGVIGHILAHLRGRCCRGLFRV